MKKYNIGIDLGGTKILAALLEKDSDRVLFEVKNKTKG
ncbi:ROK family protein, partial [Candidatus Gastranaerophilus sp. (ex Termes propinquus)]